MLSVAPQCVAGFQPFCGNTEKGKRYRFCAFTGYEAGFFDNVQTICIKIFLAVGLYYP
jgi:hypothetical protein